MIKRRSKINSFGGATYMIDFGVVFRIIIEDDNNKNLLAKTYRRGVFKDKLLYSTSYSDDWSATIPLLIRKLESYASQNEKQTFTSDYWGESMDRCMLSAPKSIDKWTKWFLSQKENLPKTGMRFVGGIIYEYDHSGNNILETRFNSKNEKSGQMELTHNPVTNLLEEEKWTKYVGSTKLFNLRYRYKYNSLNQLIEEINYDKSGEIEFRYVKKYDEKGNYIDWIKYDGQSNLIWKVTNQYFENNKLSIQIHFDQDNIQESVCEYTLNEMGDWEFMYRNKILATKNVRQYYGDTGNLKHTETISFENGKDISSRRVTDYNEKGLRIKVQEFDSNNSLTALWIHRYDDYKNEIETRKYRPN